MEYEVTGKDCFYAIKKNDIILGFYEQTTRKRAFQGAFKLMEKIVSYNEELEKGISARFPTCNIECVPQQDKTSFQGVEALFLFVLIKFYTVKDFDKPQIRFFTILENEQNDYTFVQNDTINKSPYALDDEKKAFIHQFNVYTNSLQSKWQKFIVEEGIDDYLLTYDKQFGEIKRRNLPNFSDRYGTKIDFRKGTRNIYNYFKEYFAQNQDATDSDLKLINNMMERYVFYGLYEYVFTDKEIQEAKRNRDGWQTIMVELVALREKYSENMSLEDLRKEIDRLKEYE